MDAKDALPILMHLHNLIPHIEQTRVATYPVCKQYDATCNTDIRTGAEIVAATADENLLVYTDSNQDTIGFIDISDASHPEGKGYLEMPGTPSSVAIKSNYALVSVDQGGVVAAVNSNARFVSHTIPILFYINLCVLATKLLILHLQLQDDCRRFGGRRHFKHSSCDCTYNQSRRTSRRDRSQSRQEVCRGSNRERAR